MRAAVFTTSYPRDADDFAGRFVADSVKRLRARGVEIEVVHPGVYRTFGIDYNGAGIVANVKRRPWIAPFLFVSMIVALRKVARRADLVEAHWLAGGIVALFCGKPFVVVLHGSISGGFLDEFKMAKRAPWLMRFVLNRAAATTCVSRALCDSAISVGARNVHWIPNGIDIPDTPGAEAQPPYVFFTGRMSPEKGVEDLAAIKDKLPLVVCGRGPLEHLFPESLGYVSRERLAELYAGAAVVAVPSHAEGFGIVCAEAMAYGKPVVAGRTGGLVNLIDSGVTGVLVEPGDRNALLSAIQQLLTDADLRQKLGSAARERVAQLCSWDSVTEKRYEVWKAVASA